MKRHVLLCAVGFLILMPRANAQKPFTLEQVMSAPFPTELTAAPARGRVAWVFNAQGRRNLWVAEPAADGSYRVRQATSYEEDDGQDLGQLSWSADATTIVYTRGGDLEFLNRPYPNAQSSPQGVEQGIWALSFESGETKLLGEGHSPAVSPKGDGVAFILKSQVWFAKLSGNIKAAFAREHYVQNQRVEWLLLLEQTRERGFAISGHFHGMTLRLQVEAQTLRKMGFVFDHEHPAHATLRGSASVTVVPFPRPSL